MTKPKSKVITVHVTGPLGKRSVGPPKATEEETAEGA